MHVADDFGVELLRDDHAHSFVVGADVEVLDELPAADDAEVVGAGHVVVGVAYILGRARLAEPQQVAIDELGLPWHLVQAEVVDDGYLPAQDQARIGLLQLVQGDGGGFAHWLDFLFLQR